jgi:mannose/fructose/N-acetylgalactosamine-specific phosphotransferase system component IIC
MSELLLVLLGGLIALDGVAVGQFMLSRPLVAGLLAGTVAGDAASGAAVGAILEAYLLVVVPSGGARYPEPGPATVVAATAAVWVGGPEGLALGVAGGLIWGQVGAFSQTMLRHAIARLVPVPGEGRSGAVAVAHAHVGAIFLDFARGCVVTAAGLALAWLITPHLSPAWPLEARTTRALLLMGAFVSFGILARGGAVQTRRLLLYGAGLVAGLVAGLLAGTTSS